MSRPLFPFGYGLSYTQFEYRQLQLGCTDMSQGAVMPVVVNVANVGTVAGDEVVLVFVSFPDTKARRPPKELKGFARVHLEAGQEKQVTIKVRLSDLDYFQMDSPTGTRASGWWRPATSTSWSEAAPTTFRCRRPSRSTATSNSQQPKPPRLGFPG